MKVLKVLMIPSFLFALLLNVESVNAQNIEVKTDSTSKEKEFKNAINVCPGGVFFGIYSANYERLIKPHHGIMGRIDYEHIPKTYSDANINAHGKAVVLNYRYHINGKLESYYAGAFARYSMYKGKGSIDDEQFEFKIPEVTLGLNIGKRWIWNSGITLNLALGYGYMKSGKEIENSSPEAEAAIKVFEKEYDFLSGFLGEFSVGYAF